MIIDYINGIDDVKEKVNERISGDQASTTIISHYELLKGAESREEQTTVANVLSNLRIYALDSASVTESSSLFRMLKKKGKMIPEQDIMVAGLVISRKETLITRDRHFKEIGNLELILI